MTSADADSYQAPFRSGANVEAYQLEPLRRALQSSRPVFADVRGTASARRFACAFDALVVDEAHHEEEGAVEHPEFTALRRSKGANPLVAATPAELEGLRPAIHRSSREHRPSRCCERSRVPARPPPRSTRCGRCPVIWLAPVG